MPAAKERVDAQAWWALILGSVTSMVIGISVTAVNVVFPELEREFAGATRSSLSWGLTGYSIALAALSLVGGRLSDRIGRRRIFRIGVWVFVAGSAGVALAPTASVFVAARLVQAVGAALSGPAALSLVIELFPVSRRLTAIAMWTGLTTLGAGIAPSLSAIVSQQLGWRWVFVVPLAASVASVLLVPRLLARDRPQEGQHGRLDIAGSAMGTAAVALAAAAITEGSHRGWSDPVTIAIVLAAVVLFPLFVRRSRRHPEPLVDLRLLSLPNMKAALFVNVVLTAAGMATWLIYPLFLAQHWHYSLTKIGFALTPLPFVASLTGILASRVAERIGTRRVMVYGALLPTIGIAWQIVLMQETPNYWVALLLGSSIFNLGFGILFSPVTGLALRDVGESRLGQASALVNALRILGGGLGVAAVIAILGNRQVVPLDVYRRAFLVPGVASVAAGIVVFTALRVPTEQRRRTHRTAPDAADALAPDGLVDPTGVT